MPFLRDKGNIQAGQRVLINGASGAAGTSGVQLACHFGAEVTGVCSTANLELVKSLEVHHVIDYTKEDFTQNGQIYDIIYDTVGKVSFSRSEHSLTPEGVYLNTVPMMEDIFHILGSKFRNGKKARLYATGLLPDRKKMKYMKYLNELVNSGELKAVIDRVYPLERIVEENPQLVVTCDCGSSDHRSLAQLVERGIDIAALKFSDVTPIGGMMLKWARGKNGL